jgi:hypothetical protein
MKLLISILLALSTLPALGMTDPPTSDDIEGLRKFISNEGSEMNIEANNRIFPPMKTAAAQQPQDLVALGNVAKDLSKAVEEHGINDERVMQAGAILVALKANEENFNSHPYSEDEKKALKSIEDLHKIFIKK